MNGFSALILGSVLLVGLATSQVPKVVPDKNNVVASRLEGDWIPDPQIGERLGTKPSESLSFKADASVLERIPPKLFAYIKDKQIYLAGTMTWSSLKGDSPAQVMPSVVVESRGNPTLVCYRAREGKELDDGESCIVMLATARDRANDILFLGGDFNNEPMRAWRRKAP